MPAVLLNPELASLARRGVRRLNRTQGFACAVSLGRDDMLAGQRAGGQCEERRPEPDRTDCRLDLLGSNNVPAERSCGTQAAVRLGRLVVKFPLREIEGNALGRPISARRRRHLNRAHAHVRHLEQQEIAAGGLAGRAGLARTQRAVGDVLARGFGRDQQRGRDVDPFLNRDVFDLHATGTGAGPGCRRGLGRRQPPAPGKHVDLALVLGIHGLALDACKLEKHLERHSVASLAGSRTRAAGRNRFILYFRPESRARRAARTASFGGRRIMTDAVGGPNNPPKDKLSLLDELANAPREPVPEGTTTLQMHAFLAVAMAKHREGRLAEAERMYRQALRWQPDQPDAYHLLGLLAAQLNRPDDALPLFERAIAFNPVVPEYYANYGNALTIAARIDDAEAE